MVSDSEVISMTDSPLPPVRFNSSPHYKSVIGTRRDKSRLDDIRSRCTTVRTYFIQGETTGLIKIGRCTGPAIERLKQLQMASPDRLTLLGEIKANIEKSLHAHFSTYRRHGEWFEPSDEIKKFISSLPPITSTERFLLHPLGHLVRCL